MATQALYRRYRPRRFGEIRGQEHVVRALRNAVINHREGQAYLFSGPRGTGKTTSARILAKVLNCEQPADGEPCCACASCLAVEAGTSYDVHELDAASNNGVAAIRELIERASLGTPGRHKVYILDEVHMLTAAAEAALLKTLEEPPAHVVFVLATTDPQKVNETIRSRTQHLRFHLLPMDELEAHVRWVAEDAGLDVGEAAIRAVLEQGGGSARDTLSALELIASVGDAGIESVDLGEFVEALVEHDPGRALTAIAHAVHHGRDPRTLTDDIIRSLRDCFLSLMAPELVALPEASAAVAAERATRLGAARLVRAMERLGQAMLEMRHAPDPRLVLDVAFVQLTHEPAAHDIGAILDRLDRLEKALAAGPVTSTPAPTAPDPATGRVPLGARARRPAAADGTASSATPASASESTPAATTPATTTPATTTPAPAPAPAAAPPAPAAAPAAVSPTPVSAAAATAAPSADTGSSDGARPATGPVGSGEVAREKWMSDVLPSLSGLARALYSVPNIVAAGPGTLTLAVPNEAQRAKNEQYRTQVEAAVAAVAGGPVRLDIVVGAARDDGAASPASLSRSAATAAPASAGAGDRSAGAADQAAGVDDDDEPIDLDDLSDVPPEAVVSPLDRLAQAFPGSELIEDRRP